MKTTLIINKGFISITEVSHEYILNEAIKFDGDIIINLDKPLIAKSICGFNISSNVPLMIENNLVANGLINSVDIEVHGSIITSKGIHVNGNLYVKRSIVTQSDDIIISGLSRCLCGVI